MSLVQKAFLLKEGDFVRCVVTDKSLIKGAKDEDFEEVTLYMSEKDIEDWIDVLKKDDEEDCY